MVRQEVKVTIGKDGNVQFDCNGFVGNGCDIITQVESALGQVTHTTDKEERWQYHIPNSEFNFA